MSKETFSKRKSKTLKRKYIRRRIGVVLLAIVALVFLGTRIALNGKVEVAKGNTGNESENKELVMEEATVELPQYKSTDIIPGRNVTFDGKNYAVNVKDVSKMVDGSYEGNEKYVFLTFDDGPSPLTEQVLDILKSENVKGTFFMLGSRLDSGQAPKDSLKRAIEEGNAIANHSYSHNFKKLYPGNITEVNYFMDEFKRTNDIMKDVLGVEFDTNVLRMPGGYNSRVYYKDRNLEELNNNLMLSGLEEAKGPGLKIVLEDGGEAFSGEVVDDFMRLLRTIHDDDMIKVINELKAAGAEAISINNQRIIYNTEIYCGGQFLRMNGVKIPAPFYVNAIGDPEKMENQIMRDGSYIKTLMNRGIKVQITKSDDITMPAYISDMNSKYMEPNTK